MCLRIICRKKSYFFMRIIIPLEAYPFTHMASMKYFDYKNIQVMQVIVYCPYSHLGFSFKFHFALDVVLFSSDLSLILLKHKLRHIKNFQEFIWAKIHLNRAVSNLVDRKELWGAVQNETFRQKGQKQGSYTGEKEDWFLQRSFLWGDGLSHRWPHWSWSAGLRFLFWQSWNCKLNLSLVTWSWA